MHERAEHVLAESGKVLYIIVCAAGPAGDVGELVTMAQDDEWLVQIIAKTARWPPAPRSCIRSRRYVTKVRTCSSVPVSLLEAHLASAGIDRIDSYPWQNTDARAWSIRCATVPRSASSMATVTETANCSRPSGEV